ncbi:hypothetical protein RMATCC62417_07045 [Rhizopus microsporus]|nr:hypothetical protein RMATCC62417_07045 [Rhizopus microsporus]
MKFSTKAIFFFLAYILLSTTSILASPLRDVSTTSVDLTENPIDINGDETLYVTVTRVDDLLDDDGSLLAERVMAVRVTFDVFENRLMCNGQPVEIGVSNIQVEAQMVSNPEKLTITSEEDAAILADSFDTGLVTVEITATLLDELKTDDGMVFRRLSVKELITEVNGAKVVQTEAAQQILDVFDNGALVKWTVDPLTGFMLPADDNSDAPASSESALDSVSTWWHSQSSLNQEAICTGAAASGFLLLTLAFVLIHRSLKKKREYELVQEEEQPPAYDEQEETAVEEKKPFLASN